MNGRIITRLLIVLSVLAYVASMTLVPKVRQALAQAPINYNAAAGYVQGAAVNPSAAPSPVAGTVDYLALFGDGNVNFYPVGTVGACLAGAAVNSITNAITGPVCFPFSFTTVGNGVPTGQMSCAGTRSNLTAGPGDAWFDQVNLNEYICASVPTTVATSTATSTATATGTPIPTSTATTAATSTPTWLEVHGPTPSTTATPTPTPSPSPSPTPSSTPTPTVLTTTLALTSSNNNTTYNNYRISTTTGPCVTMTSTTGIVIENSNIGPCGGSAGAHTNADSNGIEITGSSSGNAIYDSYIHTETNLGSSGVYGQHIGIYDSGSSGGSEIIQGNVVAYGDQEIVAADFGSSGDQIIGNFTFNPNGDQFASSAVISAGTNQGNGIQLDQPGVAESNYMLSCRTTGAGKGSGIACSVVPGALPTPAHDSYACDVFILNDGRSRGGTATITNNYALGGGERESGTCYNKRSGTEQFTSSGNIGIQCSAATANLYTVNMGASGSTFNGDLMFSNNAGAATTGSAACGLIGNAGAFGPWTNFNVSGSNTKCDTYNNDGTHNGEYCYGSACSSILNETSNTWGSGAWPTLGLNSTVTQIENAVGTPPLIPPIPKNCTVVSPFTTQTSKPSC